MNNLYDYRKNNLVRLDLVAGQVVLTIDLFDNNSIYA